jgi:hypothetical protein
MKSASFYKKVADQDIKKGKDALARLQAGGVVPSD